MKLCICQLEAHPSKNCRILYIRISLEMQWCLANFGMEKTLLHRALATEAGTCLGSVMIFVSMATDRIVEVSICILEGTPVSANTW